AWSASERSLPLVVSIDSSQHVAIRGARVQVARRGERTAIGVIDGQARVGASRAWITVDREEGTSVTAHDRPSAPRKLLEAPDWVSTDGTCPASLAMSEPHGRAVVGACWERKASATSYRIEIAKGADFRSLL